MSDKIATLSPCAISPIAMPATGALMGTPASMSASVPPHTVAIDDEPLDSIMSDTTRIVYGKASREGKTGRIARSAKAPWPISRREGPVKRPTSPTLKGGKL